MNKRIRLAVASITVIGGLSVAQSSAVSAAHCVQNGSPGFSYFGQDGRMDDDNVGGPGGNECPANTGSPSTRAPGQNKG